MVKRRRINLIQEYNPRSVANGFKSKYVSDKTICDLLLVAKKIKDANRYAHITVKHSEILQSKSILCSAGGLGGVVYAVPMNNDGSMHNLGKYIIEKEMTGFVGADYSNSIGMIILQLKENNIGLVDYLAFGEFYLAKFLNSYMNDAVLSQANFIAGCELKIMERIVEGNTCEEDLDRLINKSNILKIVTFESVLECLFLQSKILKNDELDNFFVKNLIYSVFPELAKRFSLKELKFKKRNFLEVIKKKTFFSEEEIEEHFRFVFKNKCRKYFLDNPDNLTGQILFRCFNLRKELEIELARQLWLEGEEKNINILTYTLPKGEVGILPCKLSEVFFAKYYKDKISLIKEKNNLEIKKQLVNRGVMRNP